MIHLDRYSLISLWRLSALRLSRQINNHFRCGALSCVLSLDSRAKNIIVPLETEKISSAKRYLNDLHVHITAAAVRTILPEIWMKPDKYSPMAGHNTSLALALDAKKEKHVIEFVSTSIHSNVWPKWFMVLYVGRCKRQNQGRKCFSEKPQNIWPKTMESLLNKFSVFQMIHREMGSVQDAINTQWTKRNVTQTGSTAFFGPIFFVAPHRTARSHQSGAWTWTKPKRKKKLFHLRERWPQKFINWSKWNAVGSNTVQRTLRFYRINLSKFAVAAYMACHDSTFGSCGQGKKRTEIANFSFLFATSFPCFAPNDGRTLRLFERDQELLWNSYFHFNGVFATNTWYST